MFLSSLAVHVDAKAESSEAFFHLDLDGTEGSGIRRFLEKNESRFVNWLERLKKARSVQSDSGFFEASGLTWSDFTEFEVVAIATGDFLAEENSSEESSDPRYSIALSASVGRPFDLVGFRRWLEKESVPYYGLVGSRRIFSSSTLTSDQFRVVVPLEESNHSLTDQVALPDSENLVLEARSDGNDSRFAIWNSEVARETLGFERRQERVSQFKSLEDLPGDRQITFAGKFRGSFWSRLFSSTPDDAQESDLSILGSLRTVREFAWSANFREDSLSFQSVVVCSDKEEAAGLFALWQGLAIMAKFSLSPDPSIRPLLLLLDKLKQEVRGNKIMLVLEIDEADLQNFLEEPCPAPTPRPLRLSKEGPRRLENSLAPSFALPLLDLDEFNLGEEKGKIVVLDFWASWSGPSVRALPSLWLEMQKFKSEEVRFIAVNVDESAEQVLEFMDREDLFGLQVAMDEDAHAASLYQVKGVPQTVVIDQLGMIRKVTVGFSPMHARDVGSMVKRLLDPSPPL